MSIRLNPHKRRNTFLTTNQKLRRRSLYLLLLLMLGGNYFLPNLDGAKADAGQADAKVTTVVTEDPNEEFAAEHRSDTVDSPVYGFGGRIQGDSTAAANLPDPFSPEEIAYEVVTEPTAGIWFPTESRADSSGTEIPDVRLGVDGAITAIALDQDTAEAITFPSILGSEELPTQSPVDQETVVEYEDDIWLPSDNVDGNVDRETELDQGAGLVAAGYSGAISDDFASFGEGLETTTDPSPSNDTTMQALRIADSAVDTPPPAPFTGADVNDGGLFIGDGGFSGGSLENIDVDPCAASITAMDMQPEVHLVDDSLLQDVATEFVPVAAPQATQAAPVVAPDSADENQMLSIDSAVERGVEIALDTHAKACEMLAIDTVAAEPDIRIDSMQVDTVSSNEPTQADTVDAKPDFRRQALANGDRTVMLHITPEFVETAVLAAKYGVERYPFGASFSASPSLIVTSTGEDLFGDASPNLVGHVDAATSANVNTGPVELLFVVDANYDRFLGVPNISYDDPETLPVNIVSGGAAVEGRINHVSGDVKFGRVLINNTALSQAQQFHTDWHPDNQFVIMNPRVDYSINQTAPFVMGGSYDLGDLQARVQLAVSPSVLGVYGTNGENLQTQLQLAWKNADQGAQATLTGNLGQVDGASVLAGVGPVSVGAAHNVSGETTTVTDAFVSVGADVLPVNVTLSFQNAVTSSFGNIRAGGVTVSGPLGNRGFNVFGGGQLMFSKPDGQEIFESPSLGIFVGVGYNIVGSHQQRLDPNFSINTL